MAVGGPSWIVMNADPAESPGLNRSANLLALFGLCLGVLCASILLLRQFFLRFLAPRNPYLTGRQIPLFLTTKA